MSFGGVRLILKKWQLTLGGFDSLPRKKKTLDVFFYYSPEYVSNIFSKFDVPLN